jgi:uncharacterized protein (TIGR02598 family)
VRSPQHRQALPPGFSLVEVTLAMGIIAVSLLSLIGLLPAGLGVLRESMEATVHAQIVQRIASGLVASDFEELEAAEMAFDQEGQRVPSLDAGALYRVRIQGADPSLPGLTEAKDVEKMNSHLKRIRIGISRSNVPNAPVAWYAIQVAAS